MKSIEELISYEDLVKAMQVHPDFSTNQDGRFKHIGGKLWFPNCFYRWSVFTVLGSAITDEYDILVEGAPNDIHDSVG